MGFGSAQAVDDDVDEGVVVERHASPFRIVAQDAVLGAAGGAAVGGGVILYRMGFQDDDNYNWQRTLLMGAGIGLLAGTLWGVFDAATTPTVVAANRPVTDGLSATLGSPDLSGAVVAPVTPTWTW
jgi:hypothetical protein